MPPMPADAILLGDFNFERNALEYDRIVGPASARYGRLNNATGFVDAWVAAGHREDEGATIPAGRRIDYCFVSATLAQRVRSSWIDPEATGSDHYPLWTEIDL
jgi:endonuclease/exonuclease/phosphatase family metal-dependent hydrolase